MGIIQPKLNNFFNLQIKYHLQNFESYTIKLCEIFEGQDLNPQHKEDLTKLFKLLQIQYNEELEIDRYEFSIIIILFTKITLEHKLEQIFCLITQTGILTFQEFYWLTQSFIRATCKVNLLSIPIFDQILKLVQKMYQQMRKDIDENLMLIEVIDYIKSNSEISQFLLQFYKIQTYENAIRQQELQLQSYIKLFNSSIGLTRKYVNIDQLMKNWNAWNTDKQHQQYLLSLMLKQKQNKQKQTNFIKLSQFLLVISNYLSYIVNDIDNTNNLSIDFITYLVYAQEEIIITADRFEKIKYALCKDRQFITLHMWMDYQCIQECNKFESQLRSLVRFYEQIYSNKDFNQLIQKIQKLVKKNEKSNQTQSQYINKFLQNWLQNPGLYNIGSIELKLKIEQLLSK
ncbi:unnamed protein product [Paramecium primaurelia]|uniref:Uncharacterized protein n=1 Tax=Paramecium primaurelia TaxID=5886 RepID=A0A8S1M6H1_PARPR|nr:unnamed protein product [Paramecium primaurelia]